MTCPPGMCASRASCRDRYCPGHPGRAGRTEADDTPPVTREEAEGWVAYLTYALLAIASTCAALAWAAFTKS